MIDRWIAASARNEADWHDASVRALGVETFRTDGVWSREQMRPSIYESAIVLASVRTETGVVQDIERLVERDPDATISVRDSFNELDLTGLGFRRPTWIGELWIKDAATNPAGREVTDLEIELVEDEATLREFGFATYEGFESSDAVREAGPLGMHHPSTLKNPRIRYFVGRVGGRVVTSSIAYVGDDLVGVYGVSTLPEYRRRGYGEAITRAATKPATELDVALSPDEMARGMYRQLGFRKISEYTAWVREPTYRAVNDSLCAGCRTDNAS